MGLYVHSIGELPASATRGYYLYVLDYGWHEPIGESLRQNLEQMAKAASVSDAVVISGPKGVHFEDEVLSWHHINGEPAGDLLPAILISTRHPSTFKETFHATESGARDAILLIPLRKVCKNGQEVASVIVKIFSDIRSKASLENFAIARELRGGTGRSIVDSLLLEPNFAGVGVDLKKLVSSLRRK